jgi:hypothetical protein
MAWVTLTEINGQRIDINLGQVVAMQRTGDQTSVIVAVQGSSNNRPFTFLIRETPDQIYGLAKSNPRI